MADWERDDSGLGLREIEKRQQYRFEPHQFGTVKRLPWQRCRHCGLLTLRNPLTEWCMRVGCNANDHPEYPVRVRGSKPKVGV